MPSTSIRQNVLTQARSLVIKMGTQLLTGPDGQLDTAYLQLIAAQIAQLRRDGKSITLVSSGAIGAGMAQLDLAKRPKDIAQLQAVAAVGQPHLMARLQEALAPHQMQAAQLLLTRGDFEDRTRFLNIRNCIAQLQEMGCIPVINENDTVAVDELRLGDNDLLAALICNALRADALILLTVVDGLLDSQGQRVDLVRDVDEVSGMARKEKSARGSGGMPTKLLAGQMVAQAGEVAVIAHGRMPHVLLRLFRGESVGTVFLPAPRKLDSRQRWIGLTKKPSGIMTVDAGAAKALRGGGKSLLARGITAISGEFEKGAVVAVADPAGEEIGRGLSNYASGEVRQIMGRNSRDFTKILGQASYQEVIHCDNLVLAGNHVESA